MYVAKKMKKTILISLLYYQKRKFIFMIIREVNWKVICSDFDHNDILCECLNDDIELNRFLVNNNISDMSYFIKNIKNTNNMRIIQKNIKENISTIKTLNNIIKRKILSSKNKEKVLWEYLPCDNIDLIELFCTNVPITQNGWDKIKNSCDLIKSDIIKNIEKESKEYMEELKNILKFKNYIVVTGLFEKYQNHYGHENLSLLFITIY